MKTIYLDHNSTTPLRPEALERWREVQADGRLGNASSLHAAGRWTRHVIDESRERVAAALGCRPGEIVFTSGGTESNNLALQGSLAPGQGLLTTTVEHSSVLATARELEKGGHPLGLLGVDAAGRLALGDLEAALARRPRLVSVQAANNEVGVRHPLSEVAKRLSAMDDPPPIFHTDAVQALGKVPVELDAWGVSLASFSAHKVGGPVGVGVLYVRHGTSLRALCQGGGQETDLRPGTEDAAGIAAAAVAIELAVREREAFAEHTRACLHTLATALQIGLPDVEWIGPPLNAEDRLPNTLNVCCRESDGKVLVTRLDLEGLMVSAGSACASGSLEPSHVLLAMGRSERDARSGLRVSLGRDTTQDECKRAVDIFLKVFSPSRAT